MCSQQLCSLYVTVKVKVLQQPVVAVNAWTVGAIIEKISSFWQWHRKAVEHDRR